jgi:hypothetical protein
MVQLLFSEVYLNHLQFRIYKQKYNSINKNHLEKLVDKTRTEYPYYHRNYPRVPTVDQCGYGDTVCLHEANEQFLRDRFAVFTQ